MYINIYFIMYYVQFIAGVLNYDKNSTKTVKTVKNRKVFKHYQPCSPAM